MDKLAFITGNTFVYWTSIVYCLACATAICFFLAFYLNKTGNAAAGFAAIPLSIVLGIVLSRFVHWYSRSDSYSGFLAAMSEYTYGGYALIGVFAGCLLAASLLRLIHLHSSIGAMLDSMCLAGGAGIAVGRLASLFNGSARGQIIQSIKSLPIVYPVTNVVSGATEYRLATFMLQAVAALLIFIFLSVYYVKHLNRIKEGDICLIFLLIYCASQVVLDSTRYDSLFFRSNGFVSIVQVFSALALALAIVIFSVRMVKQRGFRWWNIPLWILIAAGMGCAGFMEYYVQRHGDQALIAYSIMSVCLCGVVLLALLIRMLGEKNETKIA